MGGAPRRQARQSRRAVVRGLALGAGGAAAFALACGGGSKDSRGEAQKQAEAQQSIGQRSDTSAQAVPGGIHQALYTADATNLDPITSPSFTANVIGAWVYSRLFKYKTGHQTAATGEVEGDLVERFEQPDPQRLVLKLRQNALWDERAPTSRRGVDADDIVFSWRRFEDGSQFRQDVATKVSPSAPVESMEATDKYTVTVKLAFPYAPIVPVLAYTRYLMILPREAEGGFDPRNETRGSGAWTLANYQRSVRFEFRRSPSWFVKDRPFLDGFDIPIVSEYAAGLAQFRAKKVWTFAVRQEDIIQTKKDLPDLNLLQDEFGRDCWTIFFGLQPGSPFLDERVRRAVSMLIDRDEWIDSFYNAGKFKAEGYPTDTRWHSHISSGWQQYWVDPRTDAIGEGKSNFQYNPAEAKKLLAAAGYPQGLNTDYSFISTPQYGSTYVQHCEVFKGMLEAHGDFKLRQVNPDYQTEFLPKVVFAKGDFKGIAVAATAVTPDIDNFLFTHFYSKSSRTKVAFQGREADARSDSLIDAQRRELDPNKRAGLIQEWQRHLAKTMALVPYPGQSPPYSLAWPWVGNRGTFRAFSGESAPQESLIHWWFDKSKYTG